MRRFWDLKRYALCGFVFAVASLCFLVLPRSAQAHIGNVPVEFINGKAVSQKANTGQTYSTAQDYAPEQSYVVNQPIDFKVDTTIFGGTYQYRWQFNIDVKEYVESTEVAHTFTQPGTFIISMEVRSDPKADWLVADTVEINIVPKAGYSLPKITAKKSIISKNKIGFEASPTVDSASQVKDITWDFGEKTTANGMSVTHEYPGIVTGPNGGALVKLVDSNGLYSYAIIEVLTSDLGVASKSTTAHKKPIAAIVGGTVGVLIVGAIVAVVVRRPKHEQEDPDGF